MVNREITAESCGFDCCSDAVGEPVQNRQDPLGAWCAPQETRAVRGPRAGTDGANAVSGAMTPSGTGNWASLVPSLNTNNYSAVANLSVPAGSQDSGIVVRGSNASDFASDLYSAQIATTGAVNLFRRNAFTWTQLATFATTIQAGATHNLKVVVSGTASVHLEVWLNGTRLISFDDASASRITSGPPGIENYDGNVKYDTFAVFP